MPKAWSEKRERQYRHIKKSAKKQGKSENRAEEIAARTVNKIRRKKGETEHGKRSSSGTGNPRSNLDDRTKQELYNLAKKRHVEGRSTMSKRELVRALQ